MKKLIILCLSLVTLFALSSCKKDTAGSKNVETEKTATSNSAVLDNGTQNSADNVTQNNPASDNITVDMTVFKDGLSSLKNPQYDMVYKLLERGVNAQLESDVVIEYPNYAVTAAQSIFSFMIFIKKKKNQHTRDFILLRKGKEKKNQ